MKGILRGNRVKRVVLNLSFDRLNILNTTLPTTLLPHKEWLGLVRDNVTTCFPSSFLK